jgi:hypothetical protein
LHSHLIEGDHRDLAQELRFLEWSVAKSLRLKIFLLDMVEKFFLLQLSHALFRGREEGIHEVERQMFFEQAFRAASKNLDDLIERRLPFK